MIEKTAAERIFPQHAANLAGKSLEECFEYVRIANMWANSESVSGPGSSLAATRRIRALIPRLFQTLDIKSVLDIPCGDFNWMQMVDLEGIRYIGADIVSTLVETNTQLWASEYRSFEHLDITSSVLPQVDIVFCRDCLVHFSYENVWRALFNIRDSGAKYLLTTSFLGSRGNRDIQNADWRPLNFRLDPFNFPIPTATVLEGCEEGNGAFSDKSLCLWNIGNLPLNNGNR